MPEIHIALLGLWSFLIVATIICRLIDRSGSSELMARTKSWWFMVGAFTVLMISGKRIGICLLAFLSFLALKEFFTMIPTRPAERRTLFWAYISIPIQFYFACIGWYGMFIIFIPVYMFLFIPARLVLSKSVDGFLHSAGVIHWGVMITVFSLSHTGYFLVLENAEYSVGAGLGLLFVLIVLTELNDVAQYVWGKSLGKRKVIAEISPGKTWAGLIGGVLTTGALSAVITPMLTPYNVVNAAAVGVVIGIAGFFGDITMSAVKRDLKLKDTGSFIPGHGGILDRLDSITFTAPLFFHVTYYLYF